MKGDPLPPGDHVARYCKNKWLLRDDSGLLGVDKEAFKPRVENGTMETEISANWLEYFEQPMIVANGCALEHHLRTIGRNLKKNGGFAIARVGAIIEAANSQGVGLQINEDPEPDDDSHAVIVGIQLEADLVHEAIAREMSVCLMSTF